LNLAFYDPARVTSVAGVDPSDGLRIKARAAPRALGFTVEILDGEAESLPFATSSFDTIVCTFTLCSGPVARDRLGGSPSRAEAWWPIPVL